MRQVSGTTQVLEITKLAHTLCEQEFMEDPNKAHLYLRGVDSAPAAYFLAFRDEYADLARLKEHVTSIPPQVFPILCTALVQFEDSVDAYDLPKSRDALAKLFGDLAELAPSGTLEPAMAEAVTDSLVRLGAPTSLVQLFGTKGGFRTPPTIQIKAKNGVDIDFSGLNSTRNLWRVAAFLDPQFKCPDGGVFFGNGWVDALERMVGALYWCDGRARRAKADNDEVARTTCRLLLKHQVQDTLLFTLAQRAPSGRTHTRFQKICCLRFTGNWPSCLSIVFQKTFRTGSPSSLRL